MQPISNEEFLQAIFGNKWQQAHVTSFMQDPGNIPAGEAARCWAGGQYRSRPLTPDSNQFYTVSLFSEANRRKANFEACYVIGLDDVKEKLPLEQVMRLPPPSAVLKSSLHSEQWLYFLATPETFVSRVDNLHDGLIKNGLAPDGKDPGMKGTTRFLRLPEGCNMKAKRIAENGGKAPRCELSQWHPERRYSLEELALPFGVDLDAPRASKADGAAAVSDHPLLGVLQGHELSPGRFEVTCPWVDEHTGADDSGTAAFTNEDGTIGFKCHHGSCDSRTGRDLLAHLGESFKDELKTWQMLREMTGAEAPPPPPASPPVSASTGGVLSSLLGMTSHDIYAREKQMKQDRFVLEGIALVGQWTAIFAGPNTGKTLLTQWLLREAVVTGGIDGSKVVYVNADDSYKGSTEKLRIAEEAGYRVLIPGDNNFRAEMLTTIMEGLVKEGTATGVVFVLDTLKKFTDLMDKKTASKFGVVAREFVSSGGTLIGLAHVNKHRVDGKSIYAGTSDIRDDSDCVYTIEHTGESKAWDGGTTHTVQFECSKSRGDVAQVAAFQYTKTKGAGYRALFDSVERIDEGTAATIKQRDGDAVEIEAITAALINGVTGATAISAFAAVTDGVTRENVARVLKAHTGELWTLKKGAHNKSIYTLIGPVLPPVSFI